MSQEKKTDVMARVNHAGEYGAVRIYQGQAALFDRSNKRAARQVKEMAAHEQEHLAFFEEMIARENIRPTALLPVWHAAGFMLGAATALLGRQAAMACTQAVEEVIDDHYTRQLDELELDGLGEEDKVLKQEIARFRDDERAHRDIALLEGEDNFPVMRLGIAAACRLAIALSSRF